ncbi:PAS domain-containing sensor histidine kinase [Croceivirga radicis]|nr:PAS domain-containing sensor histidine kinase [Croceivirga radicis]
MSLDNYHNNYFRKHSIPAMDVYQEIFENSPDVIVILDNKGRIINCNQKLVKVHKCSHKDQLIGKHVMDFGSEKAKEQHKIDWLQLEQGIALKDTIRKNIDANGNEVWIKLNSIPKLDKNQKLSYVVSIIKDITQEISYQEKYAEQILLFEKVLNTTNIGFWEWNINKNEGYISKSFKKIFGYENDPEANKSEFWKSKILTEDLSKSIYGFKKHIASKGSLPFEGEVRYRHKNGSVIWGYSKAQIIEWDKNNLPLKIVGTLTDISKLKQLSNSNENLEQFAYTASHDLQEPIKTIASLLDLFLNDYKSILNEEGMSHLNLILDETKKMNSLVTGLLDYSKLQGNSNRTTVNLNEVVKNSLNSLSKVIKEKNAKISVSNLPNAYGNETELNSLFLNLIGNALKFTKENTVPKICISGEETATHIEISISDNGIGIAKKNLTEIFNLFTRLHSSESYKGTGIGLAHCKKLIENMGGNLWVNSTVGLGSTFKFTIPLNTNYI